MAIEVGVVCEGSHDFNVIKEIVLRICDEHEIALGRFDCLQPALSATFDQVGGGGWAKVKAWCQDNGGKAYRTFIDKPLFSSSPTYDLLIIHLDGDVLDICDKVPLTGLNTAALAVSDIVAALESALLDHWMDVDPSHRDSVVPCIPVRHLEAWLLAALDATSSGVEIVSTKETFRANFAPNYPSKNKELYQRAAQDAAKLLVKIRGCCDSFNIFEARFLKASS